MNTEQLLRAGLKAAALRQSVIADNIANLNTPGFRRHKVEFESLLAEALAGGGGDVSGVSPQIVEAPTADGPEANLDLEVGELLQNVTTYKTYVRLLAKLYSQMELALRVE